MYGYLVNAILILMTHPGMLLPFKEPGFLSAIVQVVLVLSLNAPADRAPTLARATEIVYYVVFVIWAYIKARIAMYQQYQQFSNSAPGPLRKRLP
jgi:hypothetical protein